MELLYNQLLCTILINFSLGNHSNYDTLSPFPSLFVRVAKVPFQKGCTSRTIIWKLFALLFTPSRIELRSSTCSGGAWCVTSPFPVTIACVVALVVLVLLLMLPLVVVVVLDASGSGDGGALEVFSSCCCCCWLCCSCKLAPAGNSRKDVGVMHTSRRWWGKGRKKREKIRMKIVSSLMCIALDRRKLVAASSSSSSCCSTSTNSNICGVGFVCGFSPQQRIQV